MRKQTIFYVMFGLLITASSNAIIGGGIPANEKRLSIKKIVWDQTSLQRLAPQLYRKVGYCGYPRMIQLQDKSLICVYEVSGGSIECIKRLANEKNWSLPVVVATRQNGINMAVPSILLLKDQSLLIAYNPRPAPIDASKHFGIRTKKSYNGGLTWKDERLLYEAGSKFEDGCWEPAPLQLPSGEIQLFFSNEAIYTNSNEQNISVLKSFDNGLSWTTQPQIVSFRSGKRDGMPVPILSNKKDEILFSIEDNAAGEFKPAIIRSKIFNNWNAIIDGTSSSRNAALALPLPDSIYAGAPFLQQLKAGETILSYQSTNGRNQQWSQSCMVVAIGDENGRNFTSQSIPFNILLNKQGLWNSLCVLADNTVIALTSTNAYATNATEVWMITGQLVND